MSTRIYRGWLCLSIALLFVPAVGANNFSTNSQEFMKQLEEFMKASKNQQLVEVFKGFETQFKAGTFSEFEINAIIETSNVMLDRNLKPNPFFRDYLLTLTHIKKNKSGKNHFVAWIQVLNQVVTNGSREQKKLAKTFLATSPDLFKYNALRYAESKVCWFTQTPDFTIGFEEDQPCFIFSKLDLVAKYREDSIVIEKTSGKYFPSSNTWQGKNGIVRWDKTTLSEVYCEMGNYSFELQKGIYEIGDVELTYPKLFPGKKIRGSFKNKILINNQKSDKLYPQFQSKEKVWEINNLGEGIRYVGGFKLYGSTLLGDGDTEHKAMIEVTDSKNNIVFKAQAKAFKIKGNEMVIGEQVEATLYFGQDSLFHPSVNLKYNIKDRSVHLYRGKRGSDRSPFADSFHKVNIQSEKIDYYIEKDEIVINQKQDDIANGNKRVVFESLGFFDIQAYRKIQNVATVNPIAILKLISEKQKTRQFHAQELARYLNPNFDINSIKGLLYDLLAQGFILYDAETHMLELKEKVFHFADAGMDKVDYDILKIVSDSDKTNARLNTKNKDMVIADVQLVEFSDRQKVAALPFEKILVLKDNRNTHFDGKLFAGFATFEGKDFAFQYDRNQIKADSIRYFDCFIPSGEIDNKGEEVAYAITSRLEHLNGILLVDAPANKSGRKDIEMFPSFNSKGPAYVFYDDGDTQSGAYSRDSFYFKLDEFSLNNLDKITGEDLKFKGTLVSNGIFPNLKETLVLQEDHSLGFQNTSNENGYGTYENKGNFKGNISLTNKGLLASGELKYKWATINSEEIIFKPNEMHTTAKTFQLSEERSLDIEIPEVNASKVNINWHPYKDSMYIKAEEDVINLFKEDGYTLKDLLILTPDGVRGRGVFDWEIGKMEAGLYLIGANSMQSDTSNLEIKVDGLDHLALDTKNVYTLLDFDSKIGTVRANADTISTVLPYNTYITSLNEFDWDMRNETITFKADENGKGSFCSIHPDQDSLRFYGKTAFYNLKTHNLELGGITKIETADAYVFPNEGDVNILPGGVMTTLENARIVANRTNGYHIINNATVNIEGRKKYTASGFYEYQIGDRKQEFKLNNIVGEPIGKGKKKKNILLTTATGEVNEVDQFYIDHKTKFRGKISLSADSETLDFEGFAKLDAPKMPGRQWFEISCPVDKNALAIPFDQPKNYNGIPVVTGLFLSNTSRSMYPSVMMAAKSLKDRPLFETTGLFKYEVEEDVFLFGDSIKVMSNTQNGNLITYENVTGTIKAEGNFHLGSDLKYFDIKTAGTAITSFDAAQPLELDVMTGLEFFLPEKLMKIILNDINTYTLEAERIDYLKRKDFYNKALAEFIPPGKEYANNKAKMLNYGLELPSKYNPFQFLLTELQLTWNKTYGSFFSNKDQIGISAIGGKPVNKMLEAYLECRMSGGADKVYFYCSPTEGEYYYFQYENGLLTTVSSNEEYNAAVEGLKKNDKIQKKKGGDTYEIALIDGSRARMFVKRAKNARTN